MVSVPYSDFLTVTNAIGPVTYALDSGTLPAGLSLNTSTGEVSGTPTTAQTANFSVTATDIIGNVGSRAYAVTIAPYAPPTLIATSTTLAPVSATARVGENIGFTATVTAADEGSVDLIDVDSGTILATAAVNASGVATFTRSFPAAGPRGLVASFPATARFAASQSSISTVNINAAATTLAFSGAGSTVAAGNPVVLVATATRTAPAQGQVGDGSMIFSINGTDEPVVAAPHGSATFTKTLPPGSYTIGARFTPTAANDLPSTTSQSVTVTAATSTALTIPSGAVPAGAPINYVATVTPAVLGVPMTGSVNFASNGTSLGSAPLVNGVATLPTTAPGNGLYAITATYAGDSIYGGSSALAVTLTVILPPSSPVATTTTLSASTTTPAVGTPVTLTATVAAVGGVLPTGPVSFRNDTTGVVLGTVTPDMAGVARLTISLPAAGSTTISANYAGDTYTQPSSGSVVLSTGSAATTTTLSASATQVQADDAVLLTAQVARTGGGQPDIGTVAFLADGVAFAHVPTNASGVAEVSSGPISANTVFTASFQPGPSGVDTPSTSAPVTVSIGRITAYALLNVVPGADGSAEIYLDLVAPAPITRIATGTVTFHADNGLPDQTVTLVNGVAHFSFPANSFTGAGATITLSYSGDSAFEPLVSTATVQAGALPTQTSIALSASTTSVNAPVTATASVGATTVVNAGQVTFLVNGYPAGSSAVVNGTAGLVLPPLPLGNYQVTARYDGTVQHLPSSSAPALLSVVAGTPTAGELEVTLIADSQALFAAGQRIFIDARIRARFGAVSGISLSGSNGLMFACPRTSLSEGDEMTCRAVYTVSDADMAIGQVAFSVSVTADGNVSTTQSDLVLETADEQVADAFEEMGDGFIDTRARLIGASINMPSILQRRALNSSRAGTVQANTTEGSQILAFASSLEEWRNWAAARATNGLALGVLNDPLPLNVWVDADLTLHARTEGMARWGNMATAAVGADYMVTKDIMAGLIVQADWTSDMSDEGWIEGDGYLVGPYVSVALNDHLEANATLMYGGSSNTSTATMMGETFSGDFTTQRLYAKAELTGDFAIDALTVRPNASFFVGHESAGDYVVANVDGDQVQVGGSEYLEYRVTGGANVEYAMVLDNDALLTPSLGLDLGLNGALSGDDTISQAMLARVNTGLKYQVNGGVTLGLALDAEMDSTGMRSARGQISVTGGV